MRLFHKHNYQLVNKTYAPPIDDFTKVTVESAQCLKIFQEMYTGTTSFIWKCSDEKCNKILVEKLLGEIIK